MLRSFSASSQGRSIAHAQVAIMIQVAERSCFDSSIAVWERGTVSPLMRPFSSWKKYRSAKISKLAD